MFLRTVFENKENTLLETVFSENCSSLDLLFFCVVLNSKKLGTKHVLPVFFVLLVFEKT